MHGSGIYGVRILPLPTNQRNELVERHHTFPVGHQEKQMHIRHKQCAVNHHIDHLPPKMPDWLIGA